METESCDSTSARISQPNKGNMARINDLQRQQYLRNNAGVMTHEVQNVSNGNNNSEKERK